MHPNAIDQEVQEALSKLFKKEIDCISIGISLGKKTSGVDHPKLMVTGSSIRIIDELKERIMEK